MLLKLASKSLLLAITLLPTLVIAQRSKLPVYEPAIGFTPYIGADAQERHAQLMAKYDTIVSIINTYPDTDDALKQLTSEQRAIWDNRYRLHANDHLNVKWTGCSWYCSGGPDSIYASSVLPSNEEPANSADNAHDFHLGTAWVAKGSMGERITYRFQMRSPAINSITVFNGNMVSGQAWRDHARVRELMLYVNGKPLALLQLQDVTSMQTFRLGPFSSPSGKPLQLSFKVTAVYPGERFGNVAISELHFDGVRTH